MSRPAAVEITGLRKLFNGRPALDGLDLSVEEGSVFGLLGPNGAGKTTTLRILTGLARPTSGSARLLGHDVTCAPAAVKAQVGYLPEAPGFYPWTTADGLLRLVGRLSGLGGAMLRERVSALLEMTGLRGVTTRVAGYSRGMKQRLGIAQALIGAPRLLILDEPTSALDPMGRRAVLEMMAALGGRTTVLFSTHVLADVERVCDTVAILDRGRVVARGSLDELKKGRALGGVAVEVDGEPGKLVSALEGSPWLLGVERQGPGLRLRVADIEAAQRAVPAAVAAAGLALVRFETEEPSLEEVFVELLEGGRPA